MDLVRWLGGVPSYCASTAEALERQSMSKRESNFRERLDEQYPGSGGLLHKVCTWKQVWVPRIGSISKISLRGDPHMGVEQEQDDWASIWGWICRQKAHSGGTALEKPDSPCHSLRERPSDPFAKLIRSTLDLVGARGTRGTGAGSRNKPCSAWPVCSCCASWSACGLQRSGSSS